MKNTILTTLLPSLFLLIPGAFLSQAFAQEKQPEMKIVVQPQSIELSVDEQQHIRGRVVDADGKTTPDSVLFYSRDRRSVTVTPTGMVRAIEPGSFEIVAISYTSAGNNLRQTIPVKVAYPPIRKVEISMKGDATSKMYANTTRSLSYRILYEKGFVRHEADISLKSSNPEVADIDAFGQVRAKKPGTFTIMASHGDVTGRWEGEVVPNPVREVRLELSDQRIRTGDVIRLHGTALDANGREVSDAPITYSFISNTDDDLGESASAQVEQDGRFVANKPGLYTLIAKSGSAVTEQSVRVDQRQVQKELKVVGHGLISDVHTSDLWVWEGVDGRDYAVTGTWGANGEAYFWDVTDPSDMQIIDTVTVDARTVNDVKVSEDGRIAVITRENASDRKNGIVILDVTNPREVEIISEYTQGLTGGVHNAFIYEDHVFAVNNGRRYDIIDISDPKNPKTVSRFELDTPGHAIHDVWVEDGIAYSSNWDDGVVIVDVGSTKNAESPEKHNIGVGSFENPVKLGSYAYPSGWNHAAFPFKSQSTGDFYVIAGDEAFPNGINVENEPTIPAGYMHFIRFDGSWDNPKEVARYQIPEAGTHNMWVKGDTLYVAYYNAGLRIVDISGELMGNLYDQGREIAKHIPTHHKGRIPNAAMTWGPQPYKGYIFVSDWNSGLWAYKLEEGSDGDTTTGTN